LVIQEVRKKSPKVPQKPSVATGKTIENIEDIKLLKFARHGKNIFKNVRASTVGPPADFFYNI